jgi:hypothetical protein
VLQAVLEHGSLVSAAQALFLSVRTVESHLYHLRRKVGCETTMQLVAWAEAHEWLSVSEIGRKLDNSVDSLSANDALPGYTPLTGGPEVTEAPAESPRGLDASPVDSGGPMAALREENRRLRNRIAELEAENSALRKAPRSNDMASDSPSGGAGSEN